MRIEEERRRTTASIAVTNKMPANNVFKQVWNF